jgi:hypothetical protein
MYALVDKLSEAARAEILALGGCTTTTSSAAVSSSDSGVATASANEQQIDATASASINASTSTSIKSSAERMEWEFFKYCSLPVDQNPDDTDKGDETTVSLVAFDIMLKVSVIVVCVHVHIPLLARGQSHIPYLVAFIVELHYPHGSVLKYIQ